MTSQWNGIPTETECKKLEELFLAVYFNDIDKVVEFKNQFPEIYTKKDKFLIDGDTPFDVTNLTYFNQTIWLGFGWRKEIMPFVNKHRQRTEHMLDFWRAEFGQQEIHRQIEYNQFSDYFNCDNPNDLDEIFSEPVSFYLENGFKEVDLRLRNRAQCFDFVEVKKLLEQGAKSDVHFENDDDSSTLSRISGELSYLATCNLIPEFEKFEAEGYNQDFDITRMFGELLGIAAHEEMNQLLEEYYKK